MNFFRKIYALILVSCSLYSGDNYLYLTNPSTGSIVVFNIDNPASPTYITTNTNPNLMDPLVLGRFFGNHLYTANDSGMSFSIFDINNLQNPVYLNSVMNAMFVNATGVVGIGNYLYVSSLGNNQILIYDASVDPVNPTYVSTFTSPGNFNGPGGFARYGNYLYVSNNAASNMNVITVLDVSNPASPAFVTNISNANVSGPTGITVKGTYFYVANTGGGDLSVFNLDPNPLNPTYIMNFGMGNVAIPQDITVFDTYLYVTQAGQPGLAIFDLTNPTNPTFLTTFMNPNLTDTAGVAYVTYASEGVVLVSKYESDIYQKGCYVEVSWSASSSSPVRYSIVRDGKEVGSVSASTLSFNDFGTTCCGTAYNYIVYAVDASGTQSQVGSGSITVQ